MEQFLTVAKCLLDIKRGRKKKKGKQHNNNPNKIPIFLLSYEEKHFQL